MTDGNAAPAMAEFKVSIRPHPFRSEVTIARVPVGCTLADMGAGRYVVARVDGELIEDMQFRPQADQFVTLQVVPGGSNGGKAALRLIAAVAISYVSYNTLGPALAGPLNITSPAGIGAVSAVSALAGNLALNALVPPPSQNFDASAASFTPFTQTQNANTAKPFGVIPRLYGTHKMFPPLAAYPSSEETGGEQYATMLFCLGYGPLTVDPDSLKLGDTLLREFYASEDDFAANVQIREGTPDDKPLTLYAKNSVETSAGKSYEVDGDTATLTTSEGSTSFSLDIVAPALIYFSGDNKHRRQVATGFKIEYRPHSGGSWTTATLSDSTVSGDGGFATNFPYSDDGDGVHETVMLDANAGAHPSASGESCFYIIGQDTKRFAMTVKVTPPTADAYDVRVTRIATYERNDFIGVDPPLSGKAALKITPPDDDLYSDCTWTVLRSFAGDVLGNIPEGLAFIAMRIRTTGNVGGTINNFSCVATSRMPVKVGDEWVEKENSNPAWCFIDAFTDGAWDLVTRRDIWPRSPLYERLLGETA